jgi:hypothetical protein
MTKIFAVLATAAVLAASSLSVPTKADAGCMGCAIGGGVLAGALIGGAIANSAQAAPPPAYAYGPGYVEPGCFWRRERFWDGYGWRFRRVQICR